MGSNSNPRIIQRESHGQGERDRTHQNRKIVLNEIPQRGKYGFVDSQRLQTTQNNRP